VLPETPRLRKPLSKRETDVSFSTLGARILAGLIGAVVLVGVLYALVGDARPPASVVLMMAGLLAAGFLLGTRVGRLLSGRPRWRGAAARGLPGWAELRRELDRSRRAGYPLGLVRLARPPARRWDMRHLFEPSAESARALLRSSDTVWIDGGALYAMLPDTSSEGAGRVVERLLASLSLGEVRVAVTAFPEDGWTSEVLVARLHGYQISGVAFDEMDELKQRQRREQVKRAETARPRPASPSARVDREAS
jgi:hypothetical protein